MRTDGSITANIPASDLSMARSFYADVLELAPTSEIEGEVLMYRTDGGTSFTVYRTHFAGTARHTLAQWHVDDVEKEVRALQDKGVELEVYDMPGVERDDGIASMPGMGRAAWFKDSEGNILCLDEALPTGG